MNFTPAEAIADAVLFEGYILYPYRPSAIKNRQRWNFGTIYPRSFSLAQTPPERFQFSTQVLLEATSETKLSVRIRFLQLLPPAGESFESWEEGFARSRTVEAIALRDLVTGVELAFDFSGLSGEELAKASQGFEEKPRHAQLKLRADYLRDGLYRLHGSFANESKVPQAVSASPRDMQDVAFVSAHLLLALEGGSFISLLEPPDIFQAQARQCQQDGVFPVLVGEAGDRTRILCSPIILYDYPRVAPESAGDFFDGTEMDEMLALRVLTLTDEEKDQMRRGDSRARSILERTETLPQEQLAKLHGAVRELRGLAISNPASTGAGIDLIDQPFDPFAERPALQSVRVFGIDLRVGDRVRVWPQKRADILDMAMEGMAAVIEAIEQDLEDQVQFGVVLEEDPGRDMGMLRQAGHRFFFSPDEIEPLNVEAK